MNNKTLIKEIKDTDFDPAWKMGDPKGYHVRRASRGILINDDKMALLNVTKFNYHKLPGGGIEGKETIEEGFIREVLEETGCHCEILDQPGIIMEWRDQFKLLQISYVFKARVVGEVGHDALTKKEKAEGFKLEWVPVDEASKIISGDKPTNYEGKFIQTRDVSILNYIINTLGTSQFSD
jgi:8-oxo-dGTP pyrophosphatase MutT (NUDIX family)